MAIDLKGANVLVTGGAGFLATHYIMHLVEKGAKVRATLHNKEPKIRIDGVEYIKTDLRDLANCEAAVKGMDYVFHCAANTQGAGVIATTPMVHVTPNVVMNTHLLEAAYVADVKKFVFIGSGASYPDTGDRPVTEGEMLDDHPSPVYHAVAWMKRYAEILCETYGTHLKKPMPCLVIRPSNVYGPWDKYDPKSSHVTAAMIRKVFERQTPIEVWGTGEDIRDLIYIDDFMEGSFKAFDCEDDYLAINICSGTGLTVKDILNTAIEAEGFEDHDVRFDPSKPSTVPIRLISNEFAKEKIGFEAKTSLLEGIKKTCDWLRAHPEVLKA